MSLLIIPSGVLFQSVLLLNDIEFVPKEAGNALESVRMSLILKLQFISFLANKSHNKEGF